MAGTLTISGSVGSPVEYQISGSYWDGNTSSGNAWVNGDWISGWPWLHQYTDLKVHAHTNLDIQREEVKDMRGLFSVYVVDPEEGDIVYQGVVVAENAKKAEFKVLSAAMRISEDKYEVDGLDIICNRLGDVREKRKIQRVQVVDGD